MAENVGSIYYTVTLDTSQLIEGQRKVEASTGKVQTSLTQSAQAAKTHAQAVEAAGVAQREYAKNVDKAAASTDKFAMSAKAQAAAMRGLPAQFTDIATGLASGQKPLTVLLQQGGQLKDMFGGVGNAAKAMGSYIVGLINPLTIAAATVGALAVAFFKGRAESEDFKKAIALTGNQAGVTAGDLANMATRIDSIVGVTRGQAVDALLAFVNAGVKGSASIEMMASAAARLASVGGPAIETTAKAFADLGKDPLQASIKLNESTGFLTQSIYKQIKSLEEQGKHTEAVRVAQDAFAKSINSRADEVIKNLGGIESAWLKIKDAIAQASAGWMKIGSPQSGRDEFNSLLIERQKLIEDLSKPRGLFDSLGGGQVRDEERIAAINARLRELQDTEVALQKTANAKQKDQDSLAAEIEWGKIRARNLNDEKKLLKEIEEIERIGVKLGKERKEIEAEKAAARERLRDKGRKPFDQEHYLAGLREAQATEFQLIDEKEKEALRLAEKRRRSNEDGERISAETYTQAVELITVAAEQKRQELIYKMLDEAGKQHIKQEEEKQRKLDEIKNGRAYATQMSVVDSPIGKINQWEQDRYTELATLRENDLQNAELYNNAILAVEQEAANKRAEIHRKEASDKAAAEAQILGSASQMFGAMADMQKQAAGEQSKTYKAMFAVSKAFAIAQSVVNINKAIGDVAATEATWQTKLLAMASIAASTAGIIGAIKGATFGGGRQYGGPVEAGSMYRVNETGQPEMFTAANGSQYMIPTKDGSVTPANKVGGGVQWNIVVNNNASNAQASASVDQSSRTVQITIAELSNQVQTNTGQFWNALRGATNVRGRIS